MKFLTFLSIIIVYIAILSNIDCIRSNYPGIKTIVVDTNYYHLYDLSSTNRLVLLINNNSFNLENIIIPYNIKELFIYNYENIKFNITIPYYLKYLFLDENITNFNYNSIENIKHLELSTNLLKYLNTTSTQLTIYGQVIDLYHIPIDINKLIIKIDYNTVIYGLYNLHYFKNIIFLYKDEEVKQKFLDKYPFLYEY